MTFARLSRGDWLALVAALALLLVMSVDWYSTQAGEAAREDAELTSPQGGATSGEVAREVDKDAEMIASRAEKNAWQADGFADRLVLVALLASIVLAIASAFMRAADARPGWPWPPAAVTAVVGLGAVLLLAARILQKPSADIGAVVKWGAPVGLACLGALVIGARIAWKAEEAGETAEPERAERTPTRTADRPRPAPLFDPDPEAAPAPSPVAVQEPPAPYPAEDQEFEPDWAPDWSDPTAGEADPPPADEPRRRRRRWGRRNPLS